MLFIGRALWTLANPEVDGTIFDSLTDADKIMVDQHIDAGVLVVKGKKPATVIKGVKVESPKAKGPITMVYRGVPFIPTEENLKIARGLLRKQVKTVKTRLRKGDISLIKTCAAMEEGWKKRQKLLAFMEAEIKKKDKVLAKEVNDAIPEGLPETIEAPDESSAIVSSVVESEEEDIIVETQGSVPKK